MIRVQKVNTKRTNPKRRGLGRVGLVLRHNLLRIRTRLRGHFFEKSGGIPEPDTEMG